MRTLLTLIVATLIGLAATPAVGGSIGPIEVSPSLDWESDCNAPVQPTLFLDNFESYNRALAEFNTYVARVKNYIQCVQTEGKADGVDGSRSRHRNVPKLWFPSRTTSKRSHPL